MNNTTEPDVVDRIVHIYDVTENKEVRDAYAKLYNVGPVKSDKMLLSKLNEIPDLPMEKIKTTLRNKSIVNRITTIAYSYNRTTRVLKYAAVQYVKDPTKSNEQYNRKHQNSTAAARLAIRPVVIENVEDCDTIGEFNLKVRNMIYKNKVKGPRIAASKPVTVI